MANIHSNGILGRSVVWRVTRQLLLGTLLFGTGCSRQEATHAKLFDSTVPPLDAALMAQRQKFRDSQDATMRGELSPLSRIDFFHLPVGQNLVGNTQTAVVKVDAAAVQGIGEVRLTVVAAGADRKLSLHAVPAIPRNGTAVKDSPLNERDVLALGRLRLLVVGLPDDPAVALYDPTAKPRLDYQGLFYFPDDERYVAHAKLERYPTPRSVRLAASRGDDRVMQAVGTLSFSIAGIACSMEAYVEAPGSDQLFLIFKDATSGKPGGTYGAGRFLNARALPDGQVVLDFNQAWNPLCAYSHYFHCPLPPRSNYLPVAIPAGERSYSEH